MEPKVTVPLLLPLMFPTGGISGVVSPAAAGEAIEVVIVKVRRAASCLNQVWIAVCSCRSIATVLYSLFMVDPKSENTAVFRWEVDDSELCMLQWERLQSRFACLCFVVLAAVSVERTRLQLLRNSKM